LLLPSFSLAPCLPTCLPVQLVQPTSAAAAAATAPAFTVATPACFFLCSALPGVLKVGVFLLAETADVQLDPAVVQLDSVVEAIEGAGFSAKLLSSTGRVAGLAG
jgi:hypothetical protein